MSMMTKKLEEMQKRVMMETEKQIDISGDDLIRRVEELLDSLTIRVRQNEKSLKTGIDAVNLKVAEELDRMKQKGDEQSQLVMTLMSDT